MMRKTITNTVLALVTVAVLIPGTTHVDARDNELPLGPLPISQEILDIHRTNTRLFIDHLYSKTMAQGGAQLSYMLSSIFHEEYDSIVYALTKMGFNVWIGDEYFPSTAQVINYETSGTETIHNSEIADFENRMTGLLDGMIVPGMNAGDTQQAQAQAEAYRNKVIAEVDSWLADYRNKINALPGVRFPIMDSRDNDGLEKMLESSWDTPGTLQAVKFGYEGTYKINVDIRLPDFHSDINRLLDFASNIENADSAEQAWEETNLFYLEMQELQQAWDEKTREMESSITAAFNEWARQLQEHMRDDLEKYAEYASHSARYRLLVRAKTEALRAQSEIFSRIYQEIYDMHLVQYGGKNLSPAEIERIMMEGFRLGMTRGASEGMQAQRELTAKYTAAAEQERASITAAIHEQADIAETRARLLLNHLGKRLSLLGERMSGVEQEPEYQALAQQYRERAEFYRKRITLNVIDHRLKDAERIIESNRSAMDQAYREGRIDMNTDMILESLRNDREAMAEEIMAVGEDAAAISHIEAAYRVKWQELQRDFERMKYEGAREILAEIGERIPEGLSQTIREGIDMCRSGLTKVESMAQKQWQDYRNYMGESKTRGLFYDCWINTFTPLHNQHFSAFKTATENYVTKMELILQILREYETMKEAPDRYTLEQVISMKDDLVREYSLLQQIEKTYKQARENYEAARQQAYTTCLNETRGR